MPDYPLTLYASKLRGNVFSNHKVSEFASQFQWDDLIKKPTEDRRQINFYRLPADDTNQPDLYTPLHQTVFGKAPKNVFERLLKFGASKALETADGQTAYDIAKSKGLDDEILKLIELPAEIQEKESKIKKMDEGLHKTILEIAGSLIEENGQQLPQLAFFEFGNFHYPVPGMYGGFTVQRWHGDDQESDEEKKQSNTDEDRSNKNA